MRMMNDGIVRGIEPISIQDDSKIVNKVSLSDVTLHWLVKSRACPGYEVLSPKTQNGMDQDAEKEQDIVTPD